MIPGYDEFSVNWHGDDELRVFTMYGIERVYISPMPTRVVPVFVILLV